MPTTTTPTARQMLQEAKRAHDPGGVAHVLAMRRLRALDRAERIEAELAMDRYATELELENSDLREQLRDLHRAITSRVAHSEAVREIARDRGLIEEIH